MRVLLVEDDVELGLLIVSSLKNKGFIVDRFESISEGRAAASIAQYRAAIVDRMLPDGTGLELIRSLRKSGSPLPILMLTAISGANQRVEGLEAGADDYLEKPFDMNELAARLRALGRRTPHIDEEVLTAGRLSFNLTTRSATTPEGPLKLSQKENILLEQFMRRLNVTVSREQLDSAAYGYDDIVTHNALEAVISRLRKKLRSADLGVELHTMSGIGYLLRATSK